VCKEKRKSIVQRNRDEYQEACCDPTSRNCCGKTSLPQNEERWIDRGQQAPMFVSLCEASRIEQRETMFVKKKQKKRGRFPDEKKRDSCLCGEKIELRIIKITERAHLSPSRL